MEGLRKLGRFLGIQKLKESVDLPGAITRHISVVSDPSPSTQAQANAASKASLSNPTAPPQLAEKKTAKEQRDIDRGQLVNGLLQDKTEREKIIQNALAELNDIPQDHKDKFKQWMQDWSFARHSKAKQAEGGYQNALLKSFITRPMGVSEQNTQEFNKSMDAHQKNFVKMWEATIEKAVDTYVEKDRTLNEGDKFTSKDSSSLKSFAQAALKDKKLDVDNQWKQDFVSWLEGFTSDRHGRAVDAMRDGKVMRYEEYMLKSYARQSLSYPTDKGLSEEQEKELSFTMAERKKAFETMWDATVQEMNKSSTQVQEDKMGTEPTEGAKSQAPAKEATETPSISMPEMVPPTASKTSIITDEKIKQVEEHFKNSSDFELQHYGKGFCKFLSSKKDQQLAVDEKSKKDLRIEYLDLLEQSLKEENYTPSFIKNTMADYRKRFEKMLAEALPILEGKQVK